MNSNKKKKFVVKEFPRRRIKQNLRSVSWRSEMASVCRSIFLVAGSRSMAGRTRTLAHKTLNPMPVSSSSRRLSSVSRYFNFAVSFNHLPKFLFDLVWILYNFVFFHFHCSFFVLLQDCFVFGYCGVSDATPQRRRLSSVEVQNCRRLALLELAFWRLFNFLISIFQLFL